MKEPDRDEIMAVALAQPHRVGVSPFPADAWMATASGRFCILNWGDKDTQKDYWYLGERYAQLIDADRISWGLKPRQCTEMDTSPPPRTIQEMKEQRAIATTNRREAEDEMRMASYQSPKAVEELVYWDRDIARPLFARAYHGLYRLKVHFERIDSRGKRA